MFRQLWRTFLHSHYTDKLAEVKSQRAAMVAQANDLHRYLDARELALKAKIMQLEITCEVTA